MIKTIAGRVVSINEVKAIDGKSMIEVILMNSDFIDGIKPKYAGKCYVYIKNNKMYNEFLKLINITPKLAFKGNFSRIQGKNVLTNIAFISTSAKTNITIITKKEYTNLRKMAISRFLHSNNLQNTYQRLHYIKDRYFYVISKNSVQRQKLFTTNESLSLMALQVVKHSDVSRNQANYICNVVINTENPIQNLYRLLKHHMMVNTLDNEK